MLKHLVVLQIFAWGVDGVVGDSGDVGVGGVDGVVGDSGDVGVGGVDGVDGDGGVEGEDVGL